MITETKSKKKGFAKRIAAITMCATVLSAFCGISVSAASSTSTSKSWTLKRAKTSSYSGTTEVLKRYGKVTKLKNHSDSNDGVNLYLYYSVPGNGWKEAQHLFAEPGYTESASSYYKASGKSNWQGKMCSWWINGKNCEAEGSFTTK